MPAKHSVFEKIGKKFTSVKISKRVQEMAVSAIKEMSLLAMDIPNSVNLAWGLPSFETPATILLTPSATPHRPGCQQNRRCT